MFAAIFEVQPKTERWDDYLDLAKYLKPKLEKNDGFIVNERFRSNRTDGLVRSLSIWRDEKSLIRWRTLSAHHEVQKKGRFEIFEDYHLRVGEITADSEIAEKGHELKELRFDETEVGTAKVITITEVSPDRDTNTAKINLAVDLRLPETGTNGVIDQHDFESIYNPGKVLLLVSWQDVAVAKEWKPMSSGIGKLRHRQVRVIRDYGMFDRREAPQYYDDVKSKSDVTE